MWLSLVSLAQATSIDCPTGLQGLLPDRADHVPANVVPVGWYVDGAAEDQLTLWDSDGQEVEATAIVHEDVAIELVTDALVPGEIYAFGREDWQIAFRVGTEVDEERPRPPTDLGVTERTHTSNRTEIDVEWTPSDADGYEVRALDAAGGVVATAWTADPFVTLGAGPCGGTELGDDALTIEVVGRDLAGNHSKPARLELPKLSEQDLLYDRVGYCSIGPGPGGLAGLAIALLAAGRRRRAV